jgi:hypothetical protein
MTDRPNRPRDANQLAKFIVDVATGDVTLGLHPKTEAQRQGGLKGGKARADRLSPEDRKAIAQKAAASRWNKPGQ